MRRAACVRRRITPLQPWGGHRAPSRWYTRNLPPRYAASSAWSIASSSTSLIAMARRLTSSTIWSSSRDAKRRGLPPILLFSCRFSPHLLICCLMTDDECAIRDLVETWTTRSGLRRYAAVFSRRIYRRGSSISTISECSWTCSTTISRPSGEMSKSRTLKSGAKWLN